MAKKTKPKFTLPEPPSVEVLRLETVDGCGIYLSNPNHSNLYWKPITVNEESLWYQVTNNFQDHSVHPTPLQEFGIEMDCWPELFVVFPTWSNTATGCLILTGVELLIQKVLSLLPIKFHAMKFGLVANKSCSIKVLRRKIKEESLSNYF